MTLIGVNRLKTLKENMGSRLRLKIDYFHSIVIRSKIDRSGYKGLRSYFKLRKTFGERTKK